MNLMKLQGEQMVKIERKQTELTQAAIESLAAEKAKSNGTYNTPSVNEALQDIFHEKCYVCESKDVSSWQIEHLTPHNDDKDLKFAWNNLFLACAHCNNTKLSHYVPIWDCTAIDVDEHIAFRKEGWFGKPEHLKFDSLDQRIETRNTCNLLNEVYYGSTPQKKIEANFIRKKLRDELGKFKNYVRDYAQAKGKSRTELRCTILKELSSSSAFAAFKRWLIRDHADMYGDLVNCWKESEQDG